MRITDKQYKLMCELEKSGKYGTKFVPVSELLKKYDIRTIEHTTFVGLLERTVARNKEAKVRLSHLGRTEIRNYRNGYE